MTPTPTFIQTPDFTLEVKVLKTKTRLVMRPFRSLINTRTLPQTSPLLHQHLPSVLHTECFNELGLPFCEEVKATEIGHLFEHILLEYLCLIKLDQGACKACYSGKTSWNWVKEVRGTFNISINIGQTEQALLHSGLKQACHLMQLILGTRAATKPTIVLAKTVPQPKPTANLAATPLFA